jgi:NADH dehydrogenase [ubiquinone] 1 alpha subcomplex assembly factor 2
MIEQQSDVQRQVELKQLARLADERWAAKPSFLDPPPKTSKYEPATIPRDRGGYVGQTEPNHKEGVRNHVAGVRDTDSSQASERAQKKEKVNPWKVNKGGPGEEWQPQAWTPAGPGKQ